jgi:DNA-binding NtrC family response regulator
MQRKSDQLSIHSKMERLISEMIERELPLKDALREFEKIYIETAKEKFKGNKTKTAEALGIHRNTLNNLINVLKIK